MSSSTVWKFEWCILISATKINISMCILRKKKTFFAKVEANIYNLVLNEDGENTWKMFHEIITYHTSHLTRVLACGCNVLGFLRTSYCSISTGHICSVVYIFSLSWWWLMWSRDYRSQSSTFCQVAWINFCFGFEWMGRET